MKNLSIRQYLYSWSTIVGAAMGALMYVSYVAGHGNWANPILVGVCLFIAIFLPGYSRMSNLIEERVNQRFALVTAGRLARFTVQFGFNLAVFLLFTQGDVLPEAALEGIGGVEGTALLTTLASQGAQYVAVAMFNRGYGDLNRNVLLALSANVVATAAATTGLPFVKPVFVGTSLVLGALIFGFGLLSDLRSRFYPQGGVGIFFGTFNPFHATHVAIVERALNERGLSKILVHPTVVPKLHARAFERGEIRIARVEDGLAVLERTPKADLNVNYFPTGNRFFAPETRKLMIELALEEANLADRVEVLWMPDTYREKGFHGVVAEVRRAHPSVAIHGIHGSDLGGMWVRSIYDESGWIYPFAVKRRDAVSATAIRNGATGMTTRAVSAVLAQLRAGTDVVEVGQRRFHNVGGILSAIEA